MFLHFTPYDRYGELSVNADLSKFSVDFSGGELVELQSNLAAGGRAMELSELRHQFIVTVVLCVERLD
jgi:hypothetical protein